MTFVHCFSMLNVTGRCYQPAVLGIAEWACGLLQMHWHVFNLMDQGKLWPVNCPAKIETGYCNNEASMVDAHFSVTFTDTWLML
jgi:hypothetical protein